MSAGAPSPAWRPLLPAGLAGRALAAAEEIAADLRSALARADPPPPLPLNRARFALAGGLAGQALFFAYLDRALSGRGYDETAVELLELALDDLDRADATPGLYAGFAGTAWTVEHLRGWLTDAEGEDSGEEVATLVAGLLEASPWRLGYDLVSGLVGIGAFALERWPRPMGREALERVVARLAESAERSARGAAWWTAPGEMTPRAQLETPDGRHDLGLAHGTPGVIALLGQACALGVAAAAARPLLGEAVSWLLAQQNPAGAPCRFPMRLAPGEERRASRVAWCYGDLGIAAALLGAARGAGEADWERTALALARGAAARSFEDSKVIDAGLCHGAAGNGHLFNRLFQATGDQVLGRAAHDGFARALEMRRPGEGIGGFLAWVPDERLERGWHADPGFLTGAAGVGLALLAAATPIEPAWDRALLISAMPRS